MKQEQPAAFMTQTGYCHILPDRIVLTQDGNYNRPLVQQRQNRQLVFETLIFLATIAFLTYKSVQIYADDRFWSIILAIFVCLLLIRFVTTWRYAQAAIIPRDRIREVRFIKAFPYLMRSRVIVTFEDINGKRQKRLVPLPGWLNEGDRHTAEALALLKKEGLLPFPHIH